jgi:hypothetical protein
MEEPYAPLDPGGVFAAGNPYRVGRGRSESDRPPASGGGSA